MYCRLAWGNVRTSFRDYGIYLITIALGVAVFYAFNSVSEQADFLSESTNQVLELLNAVMGGVTVMLACVLGFLMVYANNFLVRRRKRELGLYQVLGMTKRQVSTVLCLECGCASLLAFAIGLGLGILISQFLVFVTAALFNETITRFGFIFSVQGLVYAAACFGVMFVVTLLFDIATVGKVRIIDLMQSERKVESQRLRPVWLCSVVCAAGLVVLGVAYWRLLQDGLPALMFGPDETGPFLVTTLLCVAGTLMFFWGVPSPAMALLSRVKGYYLRDLHLFTVRQVASRVNTTAVAMAVTALVLFLAITSVTGGMSIASGLASSLENGAPYAATVTATYGRTNQGFNYDASDADPEELAPFPEEPVDMRAWLARDYAPVMPLVTGLNQVDVHSSAPRGYKSQGNPYAEDGIATLEAFGEVSGRALPESLSSVPGSTLLQVEGVSQYNATRRFLGLEPVALAGDEYLLLCNLGPAVVSYFDTGLQTGTRFNVGGQELSPAEPRCIDDASAALYDDFGSNSGTLVVADELVLRGDLALESSVLQIQCEPGDEELLQEAIQDVEAERLQGALEEQRFADAEGRTVAYISLFVTRPEVAQDTDSITGLIGYLASYIGFVLVVGCAAILAIQQLSQTADSLGRYRLLHELGAPAAQVSRSVLSQTALSFGLPLAVGLCHAAVALVVLAEVMTILAPIDVTSSIGLIAVIFVVVYGGYFLATYLMARRLVDARHLGLKTG